MFNLRDWIVNRAKEIQKEDRESFTYWFENEAEDCGICDPPIEAQKALNFLINYLLGCDWYVCACESTRQTNTAAVFDILRKYSPKFNREWSRYVRKKNNERKK